MVNSEQNRLQRLTALLIKLQSGRPVKAQTLADQFSVTKRTIYRDLQSLERAGVPLINEEGKGFQIMKGYNVPPVMFSEEEASAIVIAELFLRSNKDISFVNSFSSAVEKMKSVLPESTKSKLCELDGRIGIVKVYTDKSLKSTYLMDIQNALIQKSVLEISYKDAKDSTTIRKIEPFAIFSDTSDNWFLIAFCRLRDAFRTFALERIAQLSILKEKYEKHSISVDEYRKEEYQNYLRRLKTD